jgi:AcrR family transcriptional regulator
MGRGGVSRTRAVGRGTLNRERVVSEALAMLDRHGVEQFSLRALADQLGVTPMAVYNHVHSKEDLLQAIAETVVGNIEYRLVRGGWPHAIAACFRTLRAACLAHPGAVPIIESAKVLPAAVFRPMEITLTTLEGVGFSAQAALRAYSLLVSFTLGQVGYQIKGWARGVDPGAAAEEHRITPRAFPAVTRATAQATWDFDSAFEFGLSVILAGLEAKRRRRRVRSR